MRRAFIDTLLELAEADERIVLLTGDLGFMALEPFAERFPKRFYNVGVAEQNMLGLATGLAEAGLIPFVYSIANFAALRPFEFLRNGAVLHHLPVRVVAVGGGFAYGAAGISHHGLEDVGIMRTQPNLTLIAPADPAQAANALRQTWDLAGPIYYRIGKNDRAHIPELGGRFKLGDLEILREGDDLLLITMGGISTEVVALADDLAAEGISAGLAIVASLNPPPIDDLSALLGGFPLAMSIEAHYINGGLGSLVAEVIAENGLNCRLLRAGVRNAPDGVSGSEDFMHRYHGLDRVSLRALVLKAIKNSILTPE